MRDAAGPVRPSSSAGADSASEELLGIADSDDRTKVAIETLYKEFQRIQTKSVATDEWFFRFLSIAVIPFLVFLGYAAITPQYRILVAALPVLSLVGLLVVCVLSSHYAYATIYGSYLQREINRLLRAEVMRDTLFGTAAYNKFTPVTVSYSIGIVLLIAVNVLAAPFITDVVNSFYVSHRQALGRAGVVLRHYWPLNLALLAIALLPALASLVATQRRLHALLAALSNQAVEDGAKTTAVAPEAAVPVTTPEKRGPVPAVTETLSKPGVKGKSRPKMR